MDILSLARELGLEILENEPLSRHTSFRIGGPARYFAAVEGLQVLQLYSACSAAGLPFVLIGNGSNILARDAGLPGLVCKLAAGELAVEENCIIAPAGCLLSSLAVAAQRAGLTGLEFAQGIPGSVGGGVFMNAGAYGGQLSDTLVESFYIDLDHSEAGERRLAAADHVFGYRHSRYMEQPNWLITRAVFAFSPGDRSAIAALMADLATQRREKQPLEYPSAGSTFKRPEGHFAGRLIEEAGLKGYAIGDAQVSEKHAGFIINRGSATCDDVLALMEHVECTVEARFGVRLEREVRLL